MRIFVFKHQLILVLLVLLTAGCNGSALTINSNLSNNSTQQAAMFPTVVGGSPLPTFSGQIDVTGIALLYTPVPVPTTAPDASTGWVAFANGMAYRQLGFTGSSGAVSLFVTRINPQNAAFRVYYTAGQLHTIDEWRGALPDAKVIINGGYFDTSNNALGLIFSDKAAYGSPSTRSDSGLFQVSGGTARIRSLWLEPLQSGESYDQALQNFPILMAQGQAAPINPDLAGSAARRSVIATDNAGNVLLIATAQGTCTLSDLIAWLAASGLDINMALNLDGGGSTALSLAAGGASQGVGGLKPIPDVIAVYAQ